MCSGRKHQQAHILLLSISELCVPEVVTDKAASALLFPTMTGPPWDHGSPSPPGVFSLYDTCYVNSLVTLGPCSLREQIPGEEGCILHNWTLGCIQGEVFAEHIASQPRDPHVCSASTWQTATASLECGGQKGIFLKSKQASGVMAHSKGRSVGKGVLAYPCQALPHQRWTQSFLSHLAS